MVKEIQVSTNEEIPSAARRILAECSGRKVFAFSGELGSGKTTFIQAMCQELGVKEKAVSPSFALVNEYHGEEPVYHLDLYRLNNAEEAVAIGIEEYLASGHYCFIEWAERITELLPADAVMIHTEVTGENSRNIKIRGC